MLWKEFKIKSKGGKGRFCPKLPGLVLFEQWLLLPPSIPCHLLSFLNLLVPELMQFLEIFGGVKKKIKGFYI